jgi:hypothetical protein
VFPGIYGENGMLKKLVNLAEKDAFSPEVLG